VAYGVGVGLSDAACSACIAYSTDTSLTEREPRLPLVAMGVLVVGDMRELRGAWRSRQTCGGGQVGLRSHLCRRQVAREESSAAFSVHAHRQPASCMPLSRVTAIGHVPRVGTRILLDARGRKVKRVVMRLGASGSRSGSEICWKRLQLSPACGQSACLSEEERVSLCECLTSGISAFESGKRLVGSE
jgi:hypothetical protein